MKYEASCAFKMKIKTKTKTQHFTFKLLDKRESFLSVFLSSPELGKVNVCFMD
jgi:hypothetical protein